MSMWRYGETIIIRNIARSDGTVTTAIPSIAISDDAELLVVYIPKHTRYKNNWVVSPEQRVASVTSVQRAALREFRDLTMQHDSIRLYLPGRGYSVGLTFDDAGGFTSWYGNLEMPFVRTPLGIDTRDLALDVVAYPDGRWHWKDEDEFARRLEVEIDTSEHQAWVKAQGREFIERFEQKTWPFNANWDRWKTTEALPPRELPANWVDDFGTHRLLATPQV